jgi:hypothetical protein
VRFFSSPLRPDGFGAHPASHQMSIGGSFSGGKAAGAWGWSFTSNYCWGQEYMVLFIRSSIYLIGALHCYPRTTGTGGTTVLVKLSKIAFLQAAANSSVLIWVQMPTTPHPPHISMCKKEWLHTCNVWKCVGPYAVLSV